MQQLIVYMIAGTFGATLTWSLQKYGLSNVVASSLVGLLGALVSSYFKSADLAAVIFTGSFVGMTDPELAALPKISVAGAFSGLLYGVAGTLFEGYGGRLGTIAFISVVLVIISVKTVQTHVIQLFRR